MNPIAQFFRELRAACFGPARSKSIGETFPATKAKFAEARAAFVLKADPDQRTPTLAVVAHQFDVAGKENNALRKENNMLCKEIARLTELVENYQRRGVVVPGKRKRG